MRIKENCTCGAVFDVETTDAFVASVRHNEFLKAHEVCRQSKGGETERIESGDTLVTKGVSNAEALL